MTKKERIEKISKLEKQLVKTVQSIYELNLNGRRLIPNPPYILVRVLPKEHITEGGIILPETDQNKPVYEGIVIETWRPFIERREFVPKDPTPEFTAQYKIIDKYFYEIEHRCHLEVGQRIAFPHFEGMSTGGYLNDKYYRMVREGVNQQTKGGLPFCSVLGILDYKGDEKVLAEIRKLTAKLGSITTSGVSAGRKSG